MEKNDYIKIHIVPEKCGYYHSADDFWLSLLKAKLESNAMSPDEKISLICEIEKLFKTGK